MRFAEGPRGAFQGLPRTEGEHSTFREDNRLRSIRDRGRESSTPDAELTPEKS